MTKFFIRVFLIIATIAITANLSYGQTDWQSYQSQTPLPKKAKLKTIKFKSYGYAAEGYVFEKQFVEGQEITFYNTKTQTDVIPVYVIPVPVSKTTLTNPIISGKYFVREENAYLESSIKQEDDDWRGRYKYSLQGIFKVSNTYNGKGLTAKTDEAKSLNVETADILQYSGFYEDGKFPITLQKNANDYALKIEFEDRTLQTIVPFDHLKEHFFSSITNIFKNTESTYARYYISLNLDDYLKNANDIILTYKNGNNFLGKVEKDNSYSNTTFVAKEGKYTFANGEVFTGELDRYSKIWTNGKWKFTDGSIENGNWLEKYDVRENELSNVETMTDKHNLAIQLYEEKKRKIEEERIAKQQAEEKKRIAEQQRKNTLINKYGDYWGELIYNKEFTPGMTKEMVLEFTSDKCYKISRSIRSGMTIETWIFDKDKMQLELLKEVADMDEDQKQAAGAAFLLMELAEGFGYNIRDQFPTLVFTNGKLTDVYQY
ncbi:MAG: hypothetical protein KBG25_08125 [Paludibacteraceae bacterium]|jgi:hypothetical protein|nr:hypothetical protein [Paludibacteraceae bacterium]OQC44938.1 MAG: hypothetical protein BWX59_01588 [Bacteroidetes bacterium ADurb.Bin028]HPK86377.1 hypothetical protein [Bacilli bacterium]